MKYQFCCLANFSTRLSQLFDIIPELFSSSSLYLMSKLFSPVGFSFHINYYYNRIFKITEVYLI